MKPSPLSRRSFIARATVFVSAVLAQSALFSGALSGAARMASAAAKKDVPLPAGAKEVPAGDAVANAIGYVADVSKVDKKKNPQFKPGQDCSNCALYVASNEGWGKCQMITSGLVRANGWCRSYNKKA